MRSLQLLILFLQSSSLIVIPMVDMRTTRLICSFENYGYFIMNLRRRYELKEWQTKTEFFDLKCSSRTRTVVRKNYQIASRSDIQYDYSFLLNPIPRIYQNMTLPLARRGYMIPKLIRLVPPNPCPMQNSLLDLFSDFEQTQTACMVQFALRYISKDWYLSSRNEKSSSSIYLTLLSFSVQGIQSNLLYILTRLIQQLQKSVIRVCGAGGQQWAQMWSNFFYIISQIIMNIIVADARRRYSDRGAVEHAELQKFVQSHRLCKSTMPVSELVGRVENLLKKNSELGSRGHSRPQQYQKKESLEQLSLYLNRENNRPIFSLFEQILSHSGGVTYDSLSRKLKTDIITVSHYCCKLKKLRLIDWQHERDGVRVFPRGLQGREGDCVVFTRHRIEPSYDIRQAFCFRELGMNENIWVNVSGQEAVARGGLTNEEVKRKIMKHAENKMVRRTVESMKFFQKNAERQGKVFQFKYRNQTQQIKEEILRRNQVKDGVEEEIQTLDQTILVWLNSKFPEFKGQHFLLHLINNKFKDYLSILGVKQSKRQCTPLKLNRYIKVLNYIHNEGGMREAELRNLIVKDQAKFNVGIMHKRSLMGILEGLKGLGILNEEEGCYYPGWVEAEGWIRRKEENGKRMREEDEVVVEAPPRKRLHISEKIERRAERLAAMGVNVFRSQYSKISQKRYKFQLFVAAFVLNSQKAVDRCFRKAFNRIVYVERKKTIQKYIPQLHILNLLEVEGEMPQINFNLKLQNFYKDLDQIVEERGETEELNIEIQNQIFKFLRKNPTKTANALRIKYGKNWSSKFQQLQRSQVVQMNESGVMLASKNRFLI